MVFFLGLVCIIGGLIIIMPLFLEKNPVLKKFDEKILPYKTVVGIAILIIGVVRFIFPYRYGRALPIFVIGDFFPSVLAILAGILISIEFLESLKGVKGSFFTKLKETLQKYQFPIGFASIFFGILHWILFKIIFF